MTRDELRRAAGCPARSAGDRAQRQDARRGGPGGRRGYPAPRGSGTGQHERWRTGEGTIRWQCQLAAPGRPARGLAPPEIAQAIAAALDEYRTAGNDGIRDSGARRGGTADRT